MTQNIAIDSNVRPPFIKTEPVPSLYPTLSESTLSSASSSDSSPIVTISTSILTSTQAVTQLQTLRALVALEREHQNQHPHERGGNITSALIDRAAIIAYVADNDSVILGGSSAGQDVASAVGNALDALAAKGYLKHKAVTTTTPMDTVAPGNNSDTDDRSGVHMAGTLRVVEQHGYALSNSLRAAIRTALKKTRGADAALAHVLEDVVERSTGLFARPKRGLVKHEMTTVSIAAATTNNAAAARTRARPIGGTAVKAAGMATPAAAKRTVKRSTLEAASGLVTPRAARKSGVITAGAASPAKRKKKEPASTPSPTRPKSHIPATPPISPASAKRAQALGSSNKRQKLSPDVATATKAALAKRSPVKQQPKPPAARSSPRRGKGAANNSDEVSTLNKESARNLKHQAPATKRTASAAKVKRAVTTAATNTKRKLSNAGKSALFAAEGAMMASAGTTGKRKRSSDEYEEDALAEEDDGQRFTWKRFKQQCTIM
ncbi:hypothetical protein HDU90_003184 [Geranomyces variabilis]|nr:hypothetical protein HDU90_003184 [Geranomyces variabilis]